MKAEHAQRQQEVEMEQKREMCKVEQLNLELLRDGKATESLLGKGRPRHSVGKETDLEFKFL